ncbi:MAG: protein kinase family protein [Slackia sp.]
MMGMFGSFSSSARKRQMYQQMAQQQAESIGIRRAAGPSGRAGCPPLPPRPLLEASHALHAAPLSLRARNSASHMAQIAAVSRRMRAHCLLARNSVPHAEPRVHDGAAVHAFSLETRNPIDDECENAFRESGGFRRKIRRVCADLLCRAHLPRRRFSSSRAARSLTALSTVALSAAMRGASPRIRTRPGRYGTPFLGVSRVDGTEVVIKKIDRAESASVREAVWAECAALSLLDHRGIARWLGIVNGRIATCGSHVRAFLPRHAAFYGIVQSRCPGTSLHRLLREGRVFSMDDIASIGASLIEMASHCASRGVIHGDIRPANVLLDERGRVSLVDFGLARFFDRSLAESAAFAYAADDVDGIVETLLFLLYSDCARVRAGGRGRPWFEELVINERQRSFLHDAFFRKESFRSFEEFGSRFAAAFPPCS